MRLALVNGTTGPVPQHGSKFRGTSASAMPVGASPSLLEASYYAGLADLAKRHGWDPFALMAVEFSESGLNPHAGGHPAVGLIQFEPFILPHVGWNDGPEAFLALSATEQLPYVERYYAMDALPAGADASLTYLTNYEPAKIAAAAGNPHYVLDVEGDPNGYYAANAGAFDVDHKGYIELADLGARLARVAQGATWDAHAAALTAAGGRSPGGWFGPIAAAVAGISLAVGAGWAWVYLHRGA